MSYETEQPSNEDYVKDSYLKQAVDKVSNVTIEEEMRLQKELLMKLRQKVVIDQEQLDEAQKKA